MTQIHIREFSPSDFKQIVSLSHTVQTDHVWQISLNGNNGDIHVDLREIRLPRPMEVAYPRNPGRLDEGWKICAIILVAEAEQGCVGYLATIDGPAPGSLWVTDVVIDVEYRRRGVATQLLGFARKHAVEKGYSSLFVEMQSKNYPAIRLAKKLNLEFAGFSDRYYPDEDIALFFRAGLN